jgi:hypothetical protein
MERKEIQMKRKFLVLIAAVGALSLAAWAVDEPKKEEAPKPAEAAKTGPAPKLVLDKTVYDFGTTSTVSQLAGKFIISNTGDAVLELKKPVPSCGCTVPALKADKLAPGEKTELNFTVNISTPRGHVEKHITLPSNDPSQPSVNLTLKADIVPTFDVVPQAVSLGNIHQGTITNIAANVKRIDGKPLGLTRAESGQAFVRVKLEPVEGSPDAGQLRIEVEAEGAPRQFNETVKVFAGDSTQPAVTVPVSGRIVGDVTANPEAQFWGIADPETWPGGHPEQQQRKFSIVLNKPGATLEIKKATTELSDVSVEVKPIEAGKSYEVVATLAKSPKQSERGSIKLETNLASQPTVELGLTVNVLKRN